MSDDEREVGTTTLRYRRLVAENYGVLLAAFVLIGLVGGWMGYTAFVAPGTVTEERTVASWSTTAELTHGGEVTRPNPIYDRGTRLEDRRAYFPRITPFLDGAHRFTYTASDNASVTAVTTIDLIVRSTDGETTYWQSSRNVGINESSGLGEATTLRTEYRFNLSRASGTIERTDDSFGETLGEPEVVVRAETRVSGEVNGEPVLRTFSRSVVFTPEGDAFVVSESGDGSETVEQTRTVERPREYPLLWRAAVPILLFVGFGGAIGLGFLRERGELDLSTADRERLTRDRFDEWLSYADLPPDPDADAVRVHSLPDLVDLAIDTDNRVLFDPSRGRYVVVDGDSRYVYHASE